IFLDSQHRVITVSYTHLDVYKRQMLCRAYYQGIYLHACLLYTSRCV
ncbi:hypothetical protein AZZ65_002969, partial [Escherichia coli]